MSVRTSWAVGAAVAEARWISRTLLEVVRIYQVEALAAVRNLRTATLEGERSRTVVGSDTPRQGRTTGQEDPEAVEGLHPIEAGAMAPVTSLQVARSLAAPKGRALGERANEVRTDVALDVRAEGQDAALDCEIRVSSVYPSAL